MINREYIKASLEKFGVNDIDVELIVLDNDLDADADVDITACKKAIHSNLTTWLPIHSNVSEGGVSESWNIEAIKMYYSALCTELNLENAIQKTSSGSLRDRSNIW